MSLYSAQIRENADQNNSEYGHFLRSEKHKHFKNQTIILELNPWSNPKFNERLIDNFNFRMNGYFDALN